MRLSNKNKILLLFFLITFLTFLIKSNAKAQTASLANVFAYNYHRNNDALFYKLQDDRSNAGPGTDKHGEEQKEEPALPALDFLHTWEILNLRPLACHAVIFFPRQAKFSPLYSFELKHSGRLTFKPFKLVIVPFWQSKQFPGELP